MDFKKIIKDKRVIYGGVGVVALIVVFVFFRTKSAPAETDDEGNSDTGYLYFPTDLGGGIGGGSATGTSDPTASLLDLSKTQVKAQTQLGIGSIGADFMTQLIDKFKNKGPAGAKFGGVSGTFGFDETGMLDFDFGFKQVATVPATPKQNTTLPAVKSVALLGGQGNSIDHRRDASFGGR